jgi:hypothetical protein
MSDPLIRRGTAAAVLLVAAIAALVSFVHIRDLAMDYGQTPLAAWLLPVSIDGTVVVASLAMLRAARIKIRTPRLARGMLGLGVGATLACNVAYGAAHGVPGALISGWPAVAFIGCAELAIGMVRITKPREPKPREPKPAAAAPKPEPAAPRQKLHSVPEASNGTRSKVIAELREMAPDDRPSGAELARLHGVDATTARRWLRAAAG